MALPALREPALVSVATSSLTLLLAVGALTAGCGGDADDGDTGLTPTPTTSLSTTSQTPSPTDGALPTRVSDGVWAGEQVILTVTPVGATAEFECAAGVITEPLRLDPRGRFDVPGIYANQPGGPVPTTGPSPPELSARYRGQLKDARHLVLTVALTESGRTEGPFELELGGDQSLERCV